MPQSHIMPGFRPTLGFTLFYLALIVLIPLSALVFKSMQLSLDQYWDILTNARVQASFRVSFVSALIAAGIAALFGFIIAWTLVRYPFPGKKTIRRADRSAVRAAHRRCRHRVGGDLRA